MVQTTETPRPTGHLDLERVFRSTSWWHPVRVPKELVIATEAGSAVSTQGSLISGYA